MMTTVERKLMDKLHGMFPGAGVMHKSISMDLGKRRWYTPNFVVYREGCRPLVVSLPYAASGLQGKLYEDASSSAVFRFFDFKVVSAK